jgi:hypothetical protein
MKSYRLLFKLSAILWFFWGAVHLFAGIMTDIFILNGDIAGAVSGIADAIELDTLKLDYPDAAGAVIGQHGFNLLWIGLTTLICSFFVWKGNRNAIFLAGLAGGLADLGYFLFLDLGGFVNFVPGTVMTLFSLAAIILSFTAHFQSKTTSETR